MLNAFRGLIIFYFFFYFLISKPVVLCFVGLAFIGTLCEPGNSVSIVEEQGGFQSVGTVAHEIGHRLALLEQMHSLFHLLYIIYILF